MTRKGGDVHKFNKVETVQAITNIMQVQHVLKTLAVDVCGAF
jgi:hypothetical protein